MVNIQQKIRVKKVGDQYIASVVGAKALMATGDTPEAAVNALREQFALHNAEVILSVDQVQKNG